MESRRVCLFFFSWLMSFFGGTSLDFIDADDGDDDFTQPRIYNQKPSLSLNLLARELKYEFNMFE